MCVIVLQEPEYSVNSTIYLTYVLYCCKNLSDLFFPATLRTLINCSSCDLLAAFRECICPSSKITEMIATNFCDCDAV